MPPKKRRARATCRIGTPPSSAVRRVGSPARAVFPGRAALFALYLRPSEALFTWVSNTLVFDRYELDDLLRYSFDMLAPPEMVARRGLTPKPT